jgi:hypothetical protein
MKNKKRKRLAHLNAETPDAAMAKQSKQIIRLSLLFGKKISEYFL